MQIEIVLTMYRNQKNCVDSCWIDITNREITGGNTVITTDRKMMSIDHIQTLYTDTIRLYNIEIETMTKVYYYRKIRVISLILRKDDYETDIKIKKDNDKYHRIVYKKYIMNKVAIIELFYRNILALLAVQDEPKTKTAKNEIIRKTKETDVFTLGEILKLSESEIQAEIQEQKKNYVPPEPVPEVVKKQPDMIF